MLLRIRGEPPYSQGGAPVYDLRMHRDPIPAGEPITDGQILRFWLPLAAMWLVMGVEQPMLSAVIARLPDAKIHLAALGVAFSLALLVESPILQMLSAATALASNRTRYRQLVTLMNWAAIGLTTLHLVVAIPSVFYGITAGILRVPMEVVAPAHRMFLIMVPFAAAVGYRRLWQGALIRYGFTSAVSTSMYIRLVATTGLLSLPLWLPGFRVSGSTAGGIAIIGGVVFGAVAAFVLFRRNVASKMPDNPTDTPLPWRQLAEFYLPLSATSILLLAARPLLTFGIARSMQPLESLATWPVVQAFLFLFTSISMSYQEAVIALVTAEPVTRRRIRQFAQRTGIGLSLLFFILSMSDASRLWYRYVMALPEELVPLSVPAMFILVPAAYFTMMKSWYRGYLVSERKTAVVGGASVVNLAVLGGVVVLLPLLVPVTGTVVAAIAWTTSIGIENVPLWNRARSLK